MKMIDMKGMITKLKRKNWYSEMLTPAVGRLRPTTKIRKMPRTPRMPTMVYVSMSMAAVSPLAFTVVARRLNIPCVWLKR